MIEVLRKSPVLRQEGNRTVQLKNIRLPAKSLSLSAEAMVDTRSVLECGSPLPLSHGAPATSESARGLAQSKSSRLDEQSSELKPVAIVFGPENGAVSEKLVYEAAREAHARTTPTFT
jgi:adenine-specific DNA-methyltransferase